MFQIRKRRRVDAPSQVYPPRMLRLARDTIGPIIRKKASGYGSKDASNPALTTVSAGPNSVFHLLPPEDSVMFVHRIRSFEKVDWEHAERMSKEMLGSVDLTGGSSRNIDQIWHYDEKNPDHYVLLEVKKTSGFAFVKPKTIQSSLRQLTALVKRCPSDPNCKGSFYLIFSVDFLSPAPNKKKIKHVTIWLIDANSKHRWKYFSGLKGEVMDV